MRIALLMKTYSLSRGGGEYDLVRLSASLADRGHEVHLFVNKIEGERDPRLTFHPVPMNNLWAPLKIRSFARNAPRAVAESGVEFDVIHSMTQCFPSDLYWNGGGLQINWIPARYGVGALDRAWLNPRHAANLWVERKIFEPGNYRQVVCLTQMEKETILDNYGVPEERLHVIPNGIDPARFNLHVNNRFREEVRKDLGLQADQTMLLFVGTDGVRKGLPQLLRALGRLSPKFEGLLVIAGNDPPERWAGEVRDNGLESSIRFHGREPMIERLYAAADLVMMPSIFEGYGNVIPEAMACGRPVFTTRWVGASDFVTEGENGWVISSCEAMEEYVERLAFALHQANLPMMGLQAAEAVRTFTWDWTVTELEKVYQLIVEERRRS
ncbi:MAG: glycosyltransferase family 4 protein [Candidatus Omnitrophica bacterium]|nr:glycosyltransferase family 4 protein [Candidatus Omnitrophota bacterium]